MSSGRIEAPATGRQRWNAAVEERIAGAALDVFEQEPISPDKPAADAAGPGAAGTRMGLVSHVAPQLTGSGTVPYPGTHALRPLESGMVLSLETTMRHPQMGYVRLEDTVVVTDTGCEGYGVRPAAGTLLAVEKPAGCRGGPQRMGIDP